MDESDATFGVFDPDDYLEYCVSSNLDILIQYSYGYFLNFLE